MVTFIGNILVCVFLLALCIALLVGIAALIVVFYKWLERDVFYEWFDERRRRKNK